MNPKLSVDLRALGWAVLPLVMGCAQLLGIEEASCDPEFDSQCDPGSSNADDDAVGDDDADDGPPPVFTEIGPLCAEYCETIAEVCTAGESAAQYASPEACVTVCENGLPVGAPGDNGGGLDTAYCRYENAVNAGAFGELDFDCATAGLGANGACGEICDVYCRLLNEQCAAVLSDDPMAQDHATCVAECEAVPRTPDPFDFEVDEGNTLECRFWHIQAAFGNAAQHCPHAAGASPCADP
jgi:hypothetical protein